MISYPNTHEELVIRILFRNIWMSCINKCLLVYEDTPTFESDNTLAQRRFTSIFGISGMLDLCIAGRRVDQTDLIP